MQKHTRKFPRVVPPVQLMPKCASCKRPFYPKVPGVEHLSLQRAVERVPHDVDEVEVVEHVKEENADGSLVLETNEAAPAAKPTVVPELADRPARYSPDTCYRWKQASPAMKKLVMEVLADKKHVNARTYAVVMLMDLLDVPADMVAGVRR